MNKMFQQCLQSSIDNIILKPNTYRPSSANTNTNTSITSTDLSLAYKDMDHLIPCHKSKQIRGNVVHV